MWFSASSVYKAKGVETVMLVTGILLVCFGTTREEARLDSVEALYTTFRENYPALRVTRAYTSPTVRRVLAYGFEEEGLRLITCYHQPGNERSRRLILRCGFAFEGILRSSGYQYDGTPMDEYSYSLTREEYFLRG